MMVRIPCAVFVALALVGLGAFLDGFAVSRHWLRHSRDGLVVLAYLCAIAIGVRA